MEGILGDHAHCVPAEPVMELMGVDAAVIFGVVLINALVDFLQEAKALRAINALSHGLTSTATVLRG